MKSRRFIVGSSLLRAESTTIVPPFVGTWCSPTSAPTSPAACPMPPRARSGYRVRWCRACRCRSGPGTSAARPPGRRARTPRSAAFRTPRATAARPPGARAQFSLASPNAATISGPCPARKLCAVSTCTQPCAPALVAIDSSAAIEAAAVIANSRWSSVYRHRQAFQSSDGFTLGTMPRGLKPDATKNGAPRREREFERSRNAALHLSLRVKTQNFRRTAPREAPLSRRPCCAPP